VGSGLRWDVAAGLATGGIQAAGSMNPCGARGAAPLDGVKTGVPSVDSAAGHLDQMPPDAVPPVAPDMMEPAQPSQPSAAGSGSDTPGQNGGAAGAAGRAGASGSAGSAAGSGGAAGGAPVPAMPERNTLTCGDRRTCQLERGEHCCISELRPVTGPAPTDLMCRTTPQPTGAAGSPSGGSSLCALTLHCASDKECGAGQVCCANENSARCTSATECMRGMQRRLECATPQDCPVGTQCCIRTEQNLAAFSSALCEPRCSVAAGSGTVCSKDEDCPSDSGTRLVCNQSYVLPTLKVCWPAQ
jgi:hypothetical protein